MKTKRKHSKNTGRLVLCIVFGFCVFNWLFLTVNNWFLLITVINSRQDLTLTLDPWTNDYASSSEDEEIDTDWFTNHLDEPGTPAILHITKEFKPIATVGGVGSVVGGLAKAQGHLRSTWAVLPRYRFIKDPHRLIFQVDVRFRGRFVKVNIYYLKAGAVHLLLVGDGKHPFFRHMWSDKIQDIYGLKPTMTYTHRDAFYAGAVKGIIEQMHRMAHPVEILRIPIAWLSFSVSSFLFFVRFPIVLQSFFDKRNIFTEQQMHSLCLHWRLRTCQ